MESHAFDFHTASSLASDYDLKVQFASADTVSSLLSIPRPLPSAVLQRISQSEVADQMDESSLVQREMRIVCGFRDEVRRIGTADQGFDPECHIIGYLLGACMVVSLVYVLVARLFARIIAEEGTIKLEGDEKALMAEDQVVVVVVVEEDVEATAPENAS